jgi:2-polyprenyl-3-methyl-5-hydroxy-6-metoxy-1,4-benzoquinol methylase
MTESEVRRYKVINNNSGDIEARNGSLRHRGGSDHHPPSGLEKVTAAVLAAANPQPGDYVIDVGCGSGLLTVPLAESGALVLAVDSSAGQVGRLTDRARGRGLDVAEVAAAPIEHLSLPPGSADLVVTSYAMHHLRNTDKDWLIASAYEWLRPGGTLVLADMMFGRGRTRSDRAIIKSKVRILASRGIGGWWRIIKNSYRFLLRVRERPVSVGAWTTMLARAGFTGITAASIVAEAGMVTGRRPAQDAAPAGADMVAVAAASR